MKTWSGPDLKHIAAVMRLENGNIIRTKLEEQCSCEPNTIGVCEHYRMCQMIAEKAEAVADQLLQLKCTVYKL